MKTQNWPPAVLAGLSMGVAGAAAIQAQRTKTPPGYVIAEVEVTDPKWDVVVRTGNPT
jgi:hypothetical protein